ncbi:flagellar biosynthesis regulator FlaF [Paenirhodobacter sp.]|uniref:flagellar biosynthesis regulator FlaF n=1 Tax=Paenirhodobacter sp. TaxID=1965326 RepID=UPI003B40E24B
MNATLMARSAYAGTDSAIRTPRDIEYEAFARVTHRLKRAGQHAKEDYPGLVRAIHDNRELWSLLAADVALPENGLPLELRKRVAFLAEFTRVQSRKVLSENASLDILIEVNTAIMRGLRNDGGTA